MDKVVVLRNRSGYLFSKFWSRKTIAVIWRKVLFGDSTDRFSFEMSETSFLLGFWTYSTPYWLDTHDFPKYLPHAACWHEVWYRTFADYLASRNIATNSLLLQCCDIALRCSIIGDVRFRRSRNLTSLTFSSVTSCRWIRFSFCTI
jgi:hypothetical protein